MKSSAGSGFDYFEFYPTIVDLGFEFINILVWVIRFLEKNLKLGKPVPTLLKRKPNCHLSFETKTRGW